jgi:8-amino-7-oxononanoate synthase
MTDHASPLQWIDDDLDQWQTLHLRRHRRTIERRGQGRITMNGRDYIDFSSNDYLGLATHPEVIAAAQHAAQKWGWGAGASSLITGYTQAHADLEKEIARFEGTPSAILFPSGFAANLGTLAALAQPGDLILSERRNHASLVDGCRLSRATVRIFDGTEPDRIPSLLDDASRFRRRLIVTDSVFSMDGDIAPLPALAEIAERFEAILYVDEAHATGILGPLGRGAAELMGVEDRVTIRMGTLSKAVGSVGGFVAGSAELIEWLANRVRPYIYSTNLPPAAAAASAKGLEIVRREPTRRLQLIELTNRLRFELAQSGWDTGLSVTQIVPLILGEASTALDLAELLAEGGFWCPAIRPPTVPPGTSRLRLSLSFHHKTNEIMDLLRLINTNRSLFRKGNPQVNRTSSTEPV